DKAKAKVKPPKGFKRPPPPNVLQTGNENCWAAALESWLAATSEPQRRRTQKELLKSTDEKGLDVTAFRTLAAAHGMSTVVVNGVAQFSADRIEERLRNASVLLIGYEVERAKVWWHDVVLYGVTIPSNDEPTYDIMDPAIGGPRTVTKAHFFPLGSDEPALIGWKASGLGKQY